VRKEIIKDCYDEEVGDPDAGGRCHIDLLYDEAEECGISREEIVKAEPTPVILSCIHAWDNMTRTLGWFPGFAAISALEITQSEPAAKARERLVGVEASKRFAQDLGGITFHERLGLPEGSLRFLALHSYKDRFHGGGELAMIVKYAYTRQLQKEALWAAHASIQLMTVHAKEIRRLCDEAVGMAQA
jgi:pyrroloquinoline quinone (PQQ) biosynthesis protein C